MLTIPVEIRKSKIHGYGVFALEDIKQGTVVWMFEPGFDRKVSRLLAENCGKKNYIFERGYINPKNADMIVLCIDEAQWINFPPPELQANLKLGGLQDGEHLLLAAINIPAGAELTVPPESDADYERKMSSYELRR
jgi:hypothetical protein